ncbi:polymer-forming cytoskeletal protein [bacterium]|nr:polymer-forming cytoskeletal protein [bacterium]
MHFLRRNRRLILQEKNRKREIRESNLKDTDSSYLRLPISLDGEITGEDDLTIEGRVHGKINLKQNNLIIEPNAVVEAEIYVHNIIIRGKVEGNLYASGKVTIEKEGQLVGDISASRISIMEGAQFKGSVKMTSSQ